jgi:hypothetical protein
LTAALDAAPRSGRKAGWRDRVRVLAGRPFKRGFSSLKRALIRFVSAAVGD